MSIRKLLRTFATLCCSCLLVPFHTTLAQAPYNTHFVPTRETPTSVLYDGFHQRFYGAVPGENSVYVLAEADGRIQAKITIPSAFALDLSVDGTRLYVTSSPTILGGGGAQGYFVVDTTTLRLVDFVQPGELGATLTNPGLPSPYLEDNVPRFIAALSDGTVAYVAEHTDSTGGSIFINQPSTNLASWLFALDFYAGPIVKSRDGSTFVSVSGSSSDDVLSLYDTASASIKANLTLTSTNGADVALSPNGQEILVGGHIILNRSLMQTGDLNSGAPFAFSSAGSTFSADGSLIYVVQGPPLSQPAISVYNAASSKLVGYLPILLAPGGNTVEAIAAGTSHHVLLPTASGFLEMDASSPLASLATNLSTSIAGVTPNAGTVSAPAAAAVSGSGFQNGSTVYFGQTQAQTTFVSANSLTVQPPPAASAGVVAVTATFAGGWAQLSPNAYSYGPVVTQQDVTAGDSAGGTTVKLYGYGLGVGSTPQVTVGGAAANVSSVTGSTGLETLTFVTPPGTVGAADIEVTSAYGSTTVKSGFRYLQEQLIGSVFPYQMVVDNARGLLYVADANSGNALSINESTLAVSTLFSSPSSPSTALSITPDGTTLISASAFGDTLDLIDLASGKHIKTIVPAPENVPDGTLPGSIVATARGTVLVSINNPNIYVGGAAYEVNLASGVVSAMDVGSEATRSGATLLASSGDGTRVYLTADGSQGIDGGELDLWSAESNQARAALQYNGGMDQLATDDTGDILLQDSNVLDSRLRQWSILSTSSALVNERSLVEGEKLHSSGALAYIPTTLGVEVADLHQGSTVLSIGMPTGSLETIDNLAIDHSGTRLYVAQTNGIRVVDLGTAPLSIGSLTPSSGSSGGGVPVVLRGSGFVPGTSVTIDGQPAATTFVDSTTLHITTPPVSVAKDIVTVTNPDGSAYSLGGAFDAATPVPAIPSLSSVQSSYLPVGSGGPGFLVEGSGFTSNSVVQLNGVPMATTFNTTGQLIASFYNLPGPGKQSVTATNPPNPTPSNAVYITTYAEGGFLNSITPATIAAGSASFEITAFGNTSFEPGSIIYWNGSPLVTTYFSSSYLYGTVPAALVANAGTASVTVVLPGHTPSNADTFTIVPALAAATLLPGLTNLGPVFSGNSASTSITVTSSGTAPLMITGVVLSDKTDFAQTNNCPASLAVQQSCVIQLTFTPTSAASLTGATTTSVSLTSNAATVLPVSVSGNAADLHFGTVSPISVTAGATVNTPLTLSVSGAVVPAGTVSLSCTAGLPAQSSCSFTPATEPLAANMSSTLSITTAAGTRGALKFPFGSHGTSEAAALLFLLLAGRGWHRRRLPGMLIAVLTAGALCSVTGCSSGGGGGSGSTLTGNTPPGSYTVTMTASVSGIARTTTIVLNVN